jgi:hypothetical protein
MKGISFVLTIILWGTSFLLLGQSKKHFYLTSAVNTTRLIDNPFKDDRYSDSNRKYLPSYGYDMGFGIKANFNSYLNLSAEYRFLRIRNHFRNFLPTGKLAPVIDRRYDVSDLNLQLGFNPINLFSKTSKLSLNIQLGIYASLEHTYFNDRYRYGKNEDPTLHMSHGRVGAINIFHQKFKWVSILYQYRTTERIWFLKTGAPRNLHTHSFGFKIWLF